MHTRRQSTVNGRRSTVRLGNNRGAAYVLALVMVLVGSVLALAMLQAGNSYFLTEDSRTKKQAAINVAQAGVDYAYWQVHYQGQPLPYSADISYSSGSVHVNAVDDGDRDPSTMLITSTGTAGSHSCTIRRVTLGLLPYHYAWCENQAINIGNILTSTSYDRGFRTNDSAYMPNVFNNISTGVWADTTITGMGNVGPKHPFGPQIAFPDIDYSYYASIASNICNYDVVFTALNVPSGAVIYVNGNPTINLYSGRYSGPITIVATGNITVKTNASPYDANSDLALITNKTITIQTSATYFQGVIYAHRNDLMGKVQIQGTQTIVGSICADDISTDHPVDIHRDPTINLDTMRRLRLPGL